jgi:hypothetical protein
MPHVSLVRAGGRGESSRGRILMLRAVHVRSLLIVAAAVVGLMTPVSGQTPATTPPKVQLTFEAGGLMTLSANGASVREVLAEWTRAGGTVFVGADKLPAMPPMTLQFEHRPEAEVAASLLRSAAGVVIGPRPPRPVGGRSALEVVYVLASSAAAAPAQPPPMVAVAPAPNRFTQTTPDEPPPPPEWPVGPGGAFTPPVPARPVGEVPVVPDLPVSAPKPTVAPPATGPGRGGGPPG